MNRPIDKTDARAAAQRWFARLLAPDCTVAERAEFESWRGADPAHAAAYSHLEDLWRRSNALRDDAGITAALQEARRPAPVQERYRWGVALSLAASLLLVVGLVFRDRIFIEDTPAVRYATAVGEQRNLMLDDGSVVVLDTASVLQVRYDKRERSLTLQEGRASFDVRQDPVRPFVVRMASGTVTAVGTQFQVQVENSVGTVTLLEGKVRVEAADSKNVSSVTLTPGQRIVIGRGELGQRQQIPDAELARALGWTKGNLVIQDMPLQSVVAEMNRYSTTKLRLDGAGLGDIPISGLFKTGDQQSFAMALEYGWSLRAERSASEIVLRRK